MKEIMPDSVKLLQNLLDYCSVKNKVIAKNIANIGTENYNRQDVEFKDVFNQNMGAYLKTTEAQHMTTLQTSGQENSQYEVIDDKNADMDSGVNNVNIEREMSELAENALRFKFATKKVGDYYKTIQGVIKGA
jgi:flagellar basal-body rod protein FlgB